MTAPLNDAAMITEVTELRAKMTPGEWVSDDLNHPTIRTNDPTEKSFAVNVHGEYYPHRHEDSLGIVALVNNARRLIELAKIGMRAIESGATISANNALTAFDRLTDGTERGMWLYDQLGGTMEELRGALVLESGAVMPEKNK